MLHDPMKILRATANTQHSQINRYSAHSVTNDNNKKESTCNSGDTGALGSIPELGRSPEEGNGNPFHYSHLGNPMDREAWRATVHGVARVGHDLATKQQ